MLNGFYWPNRWGVRYDLPPIKPNLITGEGHGHFRPLTRKLPPRKNYQHWKMKQRMIKNSRRRNR